MHSSIELSDDDTETRSRLLTAGLKATRPRLAVAEALRASTGHHTADEVHALVIRSGVELPRASVYNALAALSAAGVVTSADVGPGAAFYEFATNWHHHFVCRQCGSVADVECVVGEKPCLTPSEDVGVVDEAQVIFRGVCTECLAAERLAEGGVASES